MEVMEGSLHFVWEDSDECPGLYGSVLKYYDKENNKWCRHYAEGKQERIKSDKRIYKIMDDIKKHGLKGDAPVSESFWSFLFKR